MDYKLEEIINIPQLQDLQEKLNLVYSFPSAIIDNDGKVLTAVAWQDVCTQFHRKNTESEKECIKSDQYILKHLNDANPAVSYKCPHGMVDNAIPIIIEGKHLGNFFTGQFFLEEPDLEFFRKQAMIYGFDEKEYLLAVKKVPIWTKEKLNLYLDFIKSFIQIIADLGLTNLKEKENSKAIKERDERNYAIIQSTSDWVWEIDEHGNYSYCSEKVEQILGYSPDEIIGKSPFDFMPLDERDRIGKIFQELRTSNASIVDLENWNLHKDGHNVCLLTNGFPVLDKNGNVKGYRGADKDITERKLAEAELHESKQIVADIINTIPARVFWKDKNLIYQGCNLAFAEDASFSDPKEIIGKDDYQLKWKDLAEMYRNDDIEVIKSGSKKLNIEEPLSTADGKNITLLTNKTPLKNAKGEITGVLGTFMDITDRKVAEQELLKAKLKAEESEFQQKQLLNNALFPITITSIEGKIIYINNSAEIFFGIKHDSDLNTLSADLFWVYPEKRELFLNQIQDNGFALNFENEYISLDNKHKSALLSSSKINYKGEKVVFSIYNDITERKHAESKLIKSEEKLKEAQAISKIGNWELDLINNRLDWSDEIFKIFEINPDDFGASYEAFLNAIHPDDRELVNTTYNSSVKNHTSYQIEHRLLLPDGRIKYVQEKGESYYDTNRNPLRSIGIVQDITERKLAEIERETLFAQVTETKVELAESNNLLNEIMERVSDGFVAFDKDFNYTYVNSKGAELLGRKADEIIGKNYWIEYPEAKGTPFANAYLQAMETQKPILIEDYYEIWDRWFVNRIFPSKEGITIFFNDITESKLIEKKIRDKDMEFRKLSANVPDLIFQFTRKPDGTYCVPIASEGIKNIFGCSPEDVIEDFSPITNVIHPEDIARVIHAIEFSATHLSNFTCEFRVQLPDKGIQWIYSKSTPEKLPDGSITWYGFNVNITEQKQVEEELWESKERFKALHNASFGGIAIHDMGIILECNQGLIELTGYSMDELIGKDGLLLIAPECRKLVMDNIAIGYERPYETFGLRKNGEIYPIRLEARNIPYKGKNVRTVEFRDITEQKHAEQELIKAKEKAEESELLLKAIINNFPNANITLLDKNLIIKITGGEEYSKYTIKPDILINKYISNAFSERVYESLIEPIQKAFKGEHSFYTIEYASEYFMNYISPVSFNSNEVNYILIATINISELKKTEFELITAKEKAEESERLKTAFLANMSHEIRTPMNGILGFADLLKEPDLTSEQQQSYIRIIERSGARMLNIINDIIDISKIEAGLMKVDLKESNINDQIDYIYTFFKPEVEAKGMQLLLNNTLPAKEAIIITDREKVFAILTNLVKNAIKYTIKGKIEIGYTLIETSNTETTNSVSEGGKIYLQFYVKDSGIGIPEERQLAIFERFIQADIADSRAMEGAGLGLAITKAYTEMLGGRIWVESEEGVGSTFFFTLPYTNKQQEKTTVENTLSPENESTIHNPKVSGLKILIAEDDEISEIFITTIIKSISKEIMKTRNGIEAIEICRNNPDIDLILMDIKMPEISGYEATRQIRQFNKDVKIIAQTAFGLTGDREKAIEAGCNDYITKPIKRNILLEIIDNYFKK